MHAVIHQTQVCDRDRSNIHYVTDTFSVTSCLSPYLLQSSADVQICMYACSHLRVSDSESCGICLPRSGPYAASASKYIFVLLFALSANHFRNPWNIQNCLRRRYKCPGFNNSIRLQVHWDVWSLNRKSLDPPQTNFQRPSERFVPKFFLFMDCNIYTAETNPIKEASHNWLITDPAELACAQGENIVQAHLCTHTTLSIYAVTPWWIVMIVSASPDPVSIFPA